MCHRLFRQKLMYFRYNSNTKAQNGGCVKLHPPPLKKAVPLEPTTQIDAVEVCQHVSRTSFTEIPIVNEKLPFLKAVDVTSHIHHLELSSCYYIGSTLVFAEIIGGTYYLELSNPTDKVLRSVVEYFGISIQVVDVTSHIHHPALLNGYFSKTIQFFVKQSSGTCWHTQEDSIDISFMGGTRIFQDGGYRWWTQLHRRS